MQSQNSFKLHSILPVLNDASQPMELSNCLICTCSMPAESFTCLCPASENVWSIVVSLHISIRQARKTKKRFRCHGRHAYLWLPSITSSAISCLPLTSRMYGQLLRGRLPLFCTSLHQHRKRRRRWRGPWEGGGIVSPPASPPCKLSFAFVDSFCFFGVASELFLSALMSRLVNKNLEMNRLAPRETMVDYWIHQP